MRSTKFWFPLVVALQALFLLGLAGTSYAASWFGQEIKLRTIPVDPRDMLYGDYVILAYEMSRLSPNVWQSEGALPERGDPVYTVLAPSENGDGTYAPIAAYPRRIEPADGQVVVKGRVEYAWEEEIVVKYGLERYYVPEGTGRALERIASDMIVTVKLAPWSQAVLVGVEADVDENENENGNGNDNDGAATTP